MSDFAPLVPQVIISKEVRNAAGAMRARSERIARTLTSLSVQPTAKEAAKAELLTLADEARKLWRMV